MALTFLSRTDGEFFKLSKNFVFNSTNQKITINLYIHLSEILMRNENNVAKVDASVQATVGPSWREVLAMLNTLSAQVIWEAIRSQNSR